MSFGDQPPSPYDLHNRLKRAEAALRSVEKALEKLFRRVNVNHKRDPELDAVIDTLAGILRALEHSRGDRSGELSPPSSEWGMTLEEEDVMPSVTSLGRSMRLRLVAKDPSGVERRSDPIDVPEDE